MGPRNARRVTWVAAGLAAVALVASVVWRARPEDHRKPQLAASVPQSSGAAASDDSHASDSHYERGHVVGQLVYGMTKQQVLREVGRPARVFRWQGMPCWEYTVNEHYPADRTGPAYTMNASAACFLAGRYSVPRYKINGKWGYNLLTKKVTD